MRRRWTLPEALPDQERFLKQEVEHVLVEYEGPQIVSLRDPDGARLVAVASDESHDSVRWLQAVVDESEWSALVTGRLQLACAFLKPMLQVVDRTLGGDPIKGWDVQFENIDGQADLPDLDAFLPTETIERFKSLVEEEYPSFRATVDNPVREGSQEFPRRVA